MKNLLVILIFISSSIYAQHQSDSVFEAELKHVIDAKSRMDIIKNTIEIEQTKYSEFSGIPANNFRKITTCRFKK